MHVALMRRSLSVNKQVSIPWSVREARGWRHAVHPNVMNRRDTLTRRGQERVAAGSLLEVLVHREKSRNAKW